MAPQQRGLPLTQPPAQAQAEEEPDRTPRPGDNPVKEIQGGRLEGSEAFEEVLQFCRRIAAEDCCPSLAGGKSYGKDSRCTCLHQLRYVAPPPPVAPAASDDSSDEELETDSNLMRMVASHVTYFGSLSDTER